MTIDKTMSLSDAVRTHVHSGDTVAIEGFTHLIPFAAAHEIVRQRLTDLTLCRMTPDIVADMLIAADCVTTLVASFFASGSSGSLYEIRRRIETGEPVPLTIQEFSHHASVLRYHAGAAGLPFMPIDSFVGSDIPEGNPHIGIVEDPFSGETMHAVSALRPDAAIIHAQRADRRGNVQLWGITGVQQEVAFASDRVMVVADEVVRSDPNRTLIPAHAVDAVVEVPFGAHPSYAQGQYDRDGAFYREWTEVSRDAARLRAWIDDYVHGTRDHSEYLERIGTERLDSLVVDPRPAYTVDYGRRRSTTSAADTNGRTAR
jgi:glutaconate CoA-transferase subunit A